MTVLLAIKLGTPKPAGQKLPPKRPDDWDLKMGNEMKPTLMGMI